MKRKVLFVSEHNGARSQMAAAFFSHLCGHAFEVYSAGIDPAQIDELTMEVMREIGLNMPGNQPRWVYDLIQPGTSFTYVITMGDESVARRCPTFPDAAEQLHWSFPNPAPLKFSRDEQLAQLREIREMIKAATLNWAREVCPEPPLVRPEKSPAPKQLR